MAKLDTLAQQVKIDSSLRDMTTEERDEANRTRRETGYTDTGRTYWTVTLRYKGRKMTTPYNMGSAHTSEPGAASVLSCLISDNESVKNARSFEDWCGDMGWDSDSRRAERTYNACRDLGAKVERLLGPDYATFAEASNDY